MLRAAAWTAPAVSVVVAVPAYAAVHRRCVRRRRLQPRERRSSWNAAFDVDWRRHRRTGNVTMAMATSTRGRGVRRRAPTATSTTSPAQRSVDGARVAAGHRSCGAVVRSVDTPAAARPRWASYAFSFSQAGDRPQLHADARLDGPRPGLSVLSDRHRATGSDRSAARRPGSGAPEPRTPVAIRPAATSSTTPSVVRGNVTITYATGTISSYTITYSDRQPRAALASVDQDQVVHDHRPSASTSSPADRPAAFPLSSGGSRPVP